MQPATAVIAKVYCTLKSPYPGPIASLKDLVMIRLFFSTSKKNNGEASLTVACVATKSYEMRIPGWQELNASFALSHNCLNAWIMMCNLPQPR